MAVGTTRFALHPLVGVTCCSMTPLVVVLDEVVDEVLDVVLIDEVLVLEVLVDEVVVLDVEVVVGHGSTEPHP